MSVSVIEGVEERVRDPERLAAVQRLMLVDTSPEAAFDRLTRLATRALRAPVAIVNLIGSDRQFFKSSVGLPEPIATRREVSTDYGLCPFALASGAPLAVEDATVHPGFRDNPAVPEMGVVAYAGVPLRAADGQPVGVFCVIDHQPRRWSAEEMEMLGDLASSAMTEIELRAEIAERRRAQVDLALYRQVLAHSSEAIAIIDPQGYYLEQNARHEALVGYSDEELRGQTPAIHLGEEAFLAIARELAESDRSQVELVSRTKSGKLVDIELSAFTVRDKAGAPVCHVGIKREITERKRAEEERARLLGAEQRARAEAEAEKAMVEALNQVGLALAAELDQQRLVQAASDAATQLTGARFGAFFYNVVDDNGEAYQLYTLSGASRETFETMPMPRNTEVFGPTFRGEGVMRLADVTKDPRYGKTPPYHGMPDYHLPVRSYLAVPVISRSGEVLGGLFFGHEMPGVFTERAERLACGVAAQAAVALDNARLFQQANDAVRARDEFLSIASHELRNPVAAIKASAEMLLRLHDRSTLDETRSRRLSSILVQASTRLAALTDDLLDVSRLRSGQLTLRPQRVDLAELAREVVARQQTAATEHRLVLQTSDEPCPVMVDPDRLEQVITNLIDNAVKYSPDGGEVRVSLESDDRGLLLRVQDKGIGLPPDSEERIFQPFGRAPNAAERNIPGLGLGLYICRQIMESHGGRLWAESPGEGEGTSLLLWLPRVEHV